MALALDIPKLQEIIAYYKNGLQKNIIQIDLMFATKTDSKKNL